ncbi:hypothetical protein B4109_0920 [Geobacillus stearothermophilus]|uniref:Uncharacterized protein n=1 Tax=Geobacillus stearothermophilus TaxID=1422 RepID=A0A150M9Z2_GEOSE|nr:hypothetical protein B4109_0920 [Geobacillus stearothermophilus]
MFAVFLLFSFTKKAIRWANHFFPSMRERNRFIPSSTAREST